jgi:hypothetical protein
MCLTLTLNASSQPAALTARSRAYATLISVELTERIEPRIWNFVAAPTGGTLGLPDVTDPRRPRDLPDFPSPPRPRPSTVSNRGSNGCSTIRHCAGSLKRRSLATASNATRCGTRSRRAVALIGAARSIVIDESNLILAGNGARRSGHHEAEGRRSRRERAGGSEARWADPNGSEPPDLSTNYAGWVLSLGSTKLPDAQPHERRGYRRPGCAVVRDTTNARWAMER